jgi:iron(III) transport system permease protein
MRRLLRGLGPWARAGLGALVLGPIAALGLGAVCDRGPGGAVGVTAFHGALAVLDPYVWSCARNSLAVAAGVAAGSLVLGVGLARVVVRRRFWGRSALGAMGLAPLAVPPLFGAMGLLGPLEWAGLGPGPSRGWAAWLALGWLGLAFGVPRVALGVGEALARVDPAWEDGARAAGASRRRVWWTLTWPVVRPAAASAVAEVFTLTLVEPGAPWVLGLRRTLAFQTVEAALAPASAPRAAVLALLGLALALPVRLALRWWGGAMPGLPEQVVARPRRASWPHATALLTLLAGCVIAANIPVVGLLAQAVVLDRDGSVDGRRVSLGPLLHQARAPEALRLFAHSAGLAVAVVAFDLLAGLALAARRRLRPTSSGGAGLAGWAGGFPPLTLGVGVLLIPRLLDTIAAVLPAASLARLVRGLAAGLDPYAAPGVLLAWAVALVRLPLIADAVERALARSRPILIEAAVTLGASRRRARATIAGPLLASTLGGPILLTLALAATDAAPALILSPTSAGRTVAPGALLLASEPGGPRRAASLAAVAVGLNLTAMAFTMRGRPSTQPERLRP